MGTQGGLGSGLGAVNVEAVWVLREALAVGLGRSILRDRGGSTHGLNGGLGYGLGAVHVEEWRWGYSRT